MKRSLLFLSPIVLMLLLGLQGCKQDLSDDAIPFVPFEDIQVNLNLPEYFVLRSVGGHKYIDGGVRGILLYRVNQNAVLAFERNCSFQPNDACATIEVDGTGFRILDNCCGSVFTTEGNPESGPAWRPLRQYAVYGTINELVVTDEVLN